MVVGAEMVAGASTGMSYVFIPKSELLEQGQELGHEQEQGQEQEQEQEHQGLKVSSCMVNSVSRPN